MQRQFDRAVSSLEQITDFVDGFIDAESLDPGLSFPMNFAIEEIFTNLLKYNKADHTPVIIGLDSDGDEIAIIIRAEQDAPFDIRQSPEPDTEAPVNARQIGGLGLHLTRTLMDHIDYNHSHGQSVFKLTKKLEK